MPTEPTAEEAAKRIMYHFECADLSLTQCEVIILEALQHERKRILEKLPKKMEQKDGLDEWFEVGFNAGLDQVRKILEEK